MKKYLLGFFLLIICLFISPSTMFLRANSTSSQELEISTYYPNGVIEYQDLTNINHLTVNNDFIAYTLSSHEIYVLNKNTRTTLKFDTFSSIHQIKFVHNNLIIVEYNTSTNLGLIKYINLEEIDKNYPIHTISTINITNLIVSDIYCDDYNIYLGIIKNNQTEGVFELYEFTNRNLETPHLKDTYSNENFLSANHLLINRTYHYVLFNRTGSNARALYRTYGSTNIEITDILENIQVVEQIKFENNSYILLGTLENLSLFAAEDLSNTLTTKTNIHITNIDVFENIIYTSSSHDSTISSYQINTTENTHQFEIELDNILVCSSNSNIGRFNSASDIFVQGDTLYIADTVNNRIQTLNNNNADSIIQTPAIDQHPKGIVLDSQQNLYYTIESSANTSQLLYYTQNNDSYILSNNYYNYNNIQLGNVSDVTISPDDYIYMIDYYSPNNSLVSFNQETGLQRVQKFNNFTTNANTRLDYLKELDLLVILNDNTIYLYNPKLLEEEQDPIVSSIEISNSRDIACDTNAIYALCDNKIVLITINNGIMQINEKSLEHEEFLEFSNISFDIQNRTIYAFNKNTHCIAYFDCNIHSSSLNFEDIDNTETQTDTPHAALKVNNNAKIYDLPYSLGNHYSNIDYCIQLSSHNGYHRVLFNDQNTLKVGFIKSSYTIDETTDTTLKFNTKQKIRVITTNLKVPVYKYPTLLKNNNNAIIIEHIDIDTRINVSTNHYPITIDGKQFYLYQTQNTIGYIFNADIVLDNNTSIVNLINNNAKIQAIGVDSIEVYAEDKTTVIKTLNNNDRVYVEVFDKNAEYTYISYKDENLNTISGYIKTEYIEMDQLDSSKTILIIIIIISVIILFTIIISYFIIKKKRQ